ncbi:uncharacterized protein [Dendropsophus ebraccatus]|uniref:uncharacterized protein n=1 Tax=Dendropsophus ebraccatus TaxID=150705 RepID=UPI003831DD85
MGSIQLIPQYPVINGSVTLSLTGITEDIKDVTWYKGPNASSQYQILTYFPGNFHLVPGPLYNPKITVLNSRLLQIKDLLITDGGDYILRIDTVTSAQDMNVTLTVYESIFDDAYRAFIIGLVSATFFGVVIIVNACLYWKCATKRRKSAESVPSHSINEGCPHIKSPGGLYDSLMWRIALLILPMTTNLVLSVPKRSENISAATLGRTSDAQLSDCKHCDSPPELLESIQENLPDYENVRPIQPTEESSYMDLKFTSEDIYTELSL